jgi:flavin-dependent dehydrogenase
MNNDDVVQGIHLAITCGQKATSVLFDAANSARADDLEMAVSHLRVATIALHEAGDMAVGALENSAMSLARRLELVNDAAEKREAADAD